jgi:hypothetical protein
MPPKRGSERSSRPKPHLNWPELRSQNNPNNHSTTNFHRASTQQQDIETQEDSQQDSEEEIKAIIEDELARLR